MYSWLQGKLEPLKTEFIGTLTTSLQTRNQPTHPQMRLLRPRMLDASVTEDELIDAGGFERLSLSGTSQRLWIKLKTGYTPPLINASCLSLR
jgi:hypothetical protein